MNSLWRIQLLGKLSAQKDDLSITRFATSRAAALLARLALFSKRAHSREELADLLWPDADLEAGRLNLRVALASLRRQMEPPGTPAGSVLVADRSLIRLNPLACRSDAAEFETTLHEAARASSPIKKREMLDGALALYQGELLPSFYDEWIIDERERLQALYEEAEQQRAALPLPDLPLTLPEDFPAPPLLTQSTLVRPPSGFPIQFTRFFGRDAEKTRLAEMLCDPEISLVTLIGPGGAGKSRLALETARQIAGGFGGMVSFVPLADIDDSALIPVSIASALRLPLSGEIAPLAQVAAHLAEGDSLLVLDNLEQLGEAGALQVLALLEMTPRLTCLVTSRQRLDLEGERELLLLPLPVPDLGQSAAALTGLASVQLFVDRAQAVRADFQVTSGNAEAVAAVCRSLEGLPLALELAAARIQTLTPAQMHAQLSARLDFLTSRRRGLPARHRSLRAALEWSTQLLAPAQTRFFVQLSVFRGGWTLESAAAVCEEHNALDLLEQLRERSLIVAEEPLAPALEMRFRMLESMREFAEELLTPEENRALNRRHAEYFQQLAAEMNALWNGPQKNNVLTRLNVEYDNVQAALAFCRTNPPDESWNGGEVGMRLAASLGSYWTTRGLMREGVQWLEGALEGAGSLGARAGALAQSGWIRASMGEYGPATLALTEAVTLSRDLDDRHPLAAALRMRGVTALWSGDHQSAAPDLEEALAVSREIGDVAVMAAALNNLGILADQHGDDKVRGRALYEESLALFLQIGDTQRASYCLHNLGNIAYDFADYERAERLLRESMTLADTLGDLWHRSYCLRSLGDVLLAQGDLTGAAALLSEGRSLCHRLGDRMTEAGIALSLSKVRQVQASWVEAGALAQEALLLYQDMGHSQGRAVSWLSLAEIAAAQGHWEQAASFLRAAAACEPGLEATEHDRATALADTARAALPPDAFADAWERGRTITCDEYGFRRE